MRKLVSSKPFEFGAAGTLFDGAESWLAMLGSEGSAEPVGAEASWAEVSGRSVFSEIADPVMDPSLSAGLLAMTTGLVR